MSVKEFGVGFRDHEESDTDFIGWIVLAQRRFCYSRLQGC